MKNREDRIANEITSHMAKAKASVNIGACFAADEYCCLICNAYFGKKIFESDLQVIEDLIQFFGLQKGLYRSSCEHRRLFLLDHLRLQQQRAGVAG